MSRITQIINQQVFEFICTRIVQILVDELEGQFILTGDYNLEVGVYLERSMPFDKTELPAISVCYAKTDFSNKNQGSVDGLNTYHIDFYTSAKSSSGVAGDTQSALKLKQLIGLVRSILEDPIYKTLGVQPPFIMKSYVQEINIAAANKEDAINTSMGRITFVVVANETSKLIIPPLIEGYDTSVRIDGSGRGYFYQGENY